MWTRLADNLGRKATSAGFILTGFVLMGPALTMEWMFGEGLGASSIEKMVYGGVHVALHVFGTLCALSIAIFIVDKSKAFVTLAVVVVFFVGGYSIANMIGFASKNRGDVAHAAAENRKQELAAYKENRAYLEGRIKWLEGQSLDYDNTVKGRKDYRAEMAAAQKKLDAMQPPKTEAATLNPDGTAALLSRVVPGLKAEDVSEMLAIPFGILLYVCQILSFILGVRIWPRKPEDEVAGQEGVATEAKIAAMARPKNRALTVPAVVPATCPRGWRLRPSACPPRSCPRMCPRMCPGRGHARGHALEAAQCASGRAHRRGLRCPAQSRSDPQGALEGDPLPVSVADGAGRHPADGHEHVLQAPRRSV